MALFGSSASAASFAMALALGVVGAVIGSFAGAAALRMARDEGIVWGRSRCDSCGQALALPDLIPIISFLALSGRCRTCGAPIERIQPLAEVGGAAIGVGAWVALANPVSAVLAALMGWQLLVLALSDWRSFHLPIAAIALLAASVALLLLHAAMSGLPLASLILRQLAGGALGYVLLAAPALAFRAVRKKEGMGSADPPLMGAIGLWMGPLGVCLVVLLGAALGIAAAIASGIAGPGIGAEERAVDRALPLGTLLSIATIAVSFAGFSLLLP